MESTPFDTREHTLALAAAVPLGVTVGAARTGVASIMDATRRL